MMSSHLILSHPISHDLIRVESHSVAERHLSPAGMCEVRSEAKCEVGNEAKCEAKCEARRRASGHSEWGNVPRGRTCGVCETFAKGKSGKAEFYF